jgi:hypothetical protein
VDRPQQVTGANASDRHGRWPGLRAVLIIAAMAGALPAGAAAPVLTLEMRPAKVAWNSTAILVVGIDMPGDAQGTTLEVVVPSGFTVNPRSVPVGSAAGKKHRQFDIQPPRSYSSPSQLSVTAVLADRTGELASASVAFDFEGGIGTPQYFLAGFIGIVLGYLARVVVDTLQTLPKPPALAAGAAAANGQTPGRLTVFIQQHYYFTDFLVSVLLGLVALAALLKDGHPPEAGAYWASAAVLGFGLGVLTNSDLITRLRTR